MKNILNISQLILGFCFTFLFGEISPLDSVIHKFYAQPGIYYLKIEQHHMSTQSSSNGDLFIEDNHHLMIRLPNLSLLLDNNLFYTFYPHQNKVVIDHYINSQFNLISIPLTIIGILCCLRALTFALRSVFISARAVSKSFEFFTLLSIDTVS